LRLGCRAVAAFDFTTLVGVMTLWPTSNVNLPRAPRNANSARRSARASADQDVDAGLWRVLGALAAVLLASSVSAAMVQVEKDALIDFYRSTNQVATVFTGGWTSNYSTTSDPCAGWAGVTCAANRLTCVHTAAPLARCVLVGCVTQVAVVQQDVEFSGNGQHCWHTAVQHWRVRAAYVSRRSCVGACLVC
jgi:hypothetical protein